MQKRKKKERINNRFAMRKKGEKKLPRQNERERERWGNG